ncbi:MAG: hypothetical protein Q8876_10215, partial [Bacillota bacterium]|nr:hypothetical protein [Bacillota bacterium]
QQMQEAMQSVPNTKMVMIDSIPGWTDIHPVKKGLFGEQMYLAGLEFIDNVYSGVPMLYSEKDGVLTVISDDVPLTSSKIVCKIPADWDSFETKQFYVVLCAYKNNQLFNVYVSQRFTPEDGNNIEVPKDFVDNDIKIKAFVWNDLVNISPHK